MKSIIKVLLQEKKDIYLSILCGFIAGITAVALFSASGYLISKAALVPPIYTLMIIVASVKLLGIISALSRYGERLYSHRATFTMLSNLRVSFYEKLEPRSPRIFQKFRSGDLLSRIVGDVETLQNFFLRVFYPPIVLMLVLLSTILFTIIFSMEIAVVLFIGLMLTIIVVPACFAIGQRKIDSHVRESRGALSTDATEFLYGFRDLKIYQQLDAKETELHQSVDTYNRDHERNGIHLLFGESVNTFVSLLVSWAVLAIGAYLVTDGKLDGLFLAMLLMVSLTAFENTKTMAVFPSHLEDSRQAAARLQGVVDSVPLQKEKPLEKLSGLDSGPAIQFKDVSFTYPDETRLTLENINVTLEKGTKTAIVGPSGSGKSTLLQLLLKMYSVDHGEITINGHSIDSLTDESIWENTNVVLQANHFFYGTIRDNLLLANEQVSDEEMEAVLANVQLSHFSLSDQVLEKGENLSGGEKQRLAIARTMLKKAKLWLLDEPTSSLDAITEKKIYEQLFELAKDDTLVLVSHRLTGIEKMDQIIVIDHGKIIEAGTFNELMQQQGYFYKMKQIEQSVFM
ncbi:thiol reductant ABC exporter subunit CydC [Lederbergia graminis]|uniref:Thiol reductant ABC exporter subunit CydC n=1 Tax=Lederbergia graminis TaxID=735518 RepID=A0ABW0LM93_9BACI